MKNPKFSILITTKNRFVDLKLTLQKISHLIKREDVECLICDDGSTDDTTEFIKKTYSKIQLITHQKSKGYLFNRNYMLNSTKADYAISLDDDAHFLTDNVLNNIEIHFNKNAQCGLMALRIFWGKEESLTQDTKEIAFRVDSFVGCGHVWRMSAWKTIPNYPEWFQFYGEEFFASLQLFKHNWHIDYVPSILVQHRVDMKARKNDKDYAQRQRSSLRSGWYIYFMCYPKHLMFKKFTSSLWSQIKRKVFRGNIKATKSILLALKDLIVHIPKFVKGNYRLSKIEYQEFIKLPKVKVYWKPNE